MKVDWALTQGATPTETAEKVDFVLQYIFNKHFPFQTVSSRSCDAPWISKRIKRHIRNRKREFARSGRSRRWKKKKAKCEELILQAKEAFFEKVKKKVKEAGNTKSYFQAVKMLQSPDAPTRWAIQSMFPNLSDAQIAEMAAVYFNAISLV